MVPDIKIENILNNAYKSNICGQLPTELICYKHIEIDFNDKLYHNNIIKV